MDPFTALRRRIGRSVATSLAVALLLPIAAGPVAAGAPPNFKLPFDCGSRWYGQTIGHRRYYAVDLNQTTEDRGQRVRSSAAGLTIPVPDTDPDTNPYGTVLVDHGNGWMTLYAHMTNRIGLGVWVHEGDVLGLVGDVAPLDINAHLHYEQIHGTTTRPAAFDGVPYHYFRVGSSITSTNCRSSGSSLRARTPLHVRGLQ